VILLDVRLQRSSGLEACRAIIERHPAVKVVFLTVYDDEQYLFQALRVGAAGGVNRGARVATVLLI
jgi:DNA-binding NarL/FixJ family response regulator